ncbi:MAG TPA: MoaD/ThiS family protein [Methylomirabilota bacterium]|nr:MoaD/ThiS family protein [Methylomirabilota bacterium]
MTIRVLFMGVIAKITGQRDLLLPAEPTVTLRGVLDRLEARYGPEFSHRVFRSDTPPRPLQTHTRIFLNGNVVDESMLDQPLSSGGEPGSAEVLIYLLPAASGG